MGESGPQPLTKDVYCDVGKMQDNVLKAILRDVMGQEKFYFSLYFSSYINVQGVPEKALHLYRPQF